MGRAPAPTSQTQNTLANPTEFVCPPSSQTGGIKKPTHAFAWLFLFVVGANS